jgi:hypothetical protein
MKGPGIVSILALIAFAATLAITVGSRLSEQTMTILTGAACGAGLTAPFAILAGMYIGSQRSARDRQTVQSQQPIVVMTPPPQQPAAPALSTWPALPSSVPGMAVPSPRQYTILGEEGVIDGATDVWS